MRASSGSQKQSSQAFDEPATISSVDTNSDGGASRRVLSRAKSPTVPDRPPRLLTRQQAAAYCGVSVGTFNHVCRVRPVALGAGARMERFDIVEIDKWISNFHVKKDKNEVDWISILEKSL